MLLPDAQVPPYLARRLACPIRIPKPICGHCFAVVDSTGQTKVTHLLIVGRRHRLCARQPVQNTKWLDGAKAIRYCTLSACTQSPLRPAPSWTSYAKLTARISVRTMSESRDGPPPASLAPVDEKGKPRVTSSLRRPWASSSVIKTSPGVQREKWNRQAPYQEFFLASRKYPIHQNLVHHQRTRGRYYNSARRP